MRKYLLRLLWPLIYEHMLMLQLPLFLEIKSHFPCYLLKYDGLSLREKAVLWMCPDLFEISCLSICTESSRGEKSSFLPLKSSLLPKPVAGRGETSKGFLLSLSFLLCSLGYWILYNNSKGTCLKMNSIIRFFSFWSFQFFRVCNSLMLLNIFESVLAACKSTMEGKFMASNELD